MAQFDYGKVKDPLIFAENRVEAHSDHICYASLEELKEQKSSFRHSLDGLWKFSYTPNNCGGKIPQMIERAVKKKLLYKLHDRFWHIPRIY